MDFPGKNTRVGSYSLLQGFFLTQGSNLGLLHCRQILYHLSHQGSPTLLSFSFFFFFLAALDLPCFVWAFSRCSEWGLLIVAVRRLLILSTASSRYVGSGVVVHGLSCSEARLIFLQKESNACPHFGRQILYH